MSLLQASISWLTSRLLSATSLAATMFSWTYCAKLKSQSSECDSNYLCIERDVRWHAATQPGRCRIRRTAASTPPRSSDLRWGTYSSPCKQPSVWSLSPPRLAGAARLSAESAVSAPWICSAPSNASTRLDTLSEHCDRGTAQKYKLRLFYSAF